MPPTLTLLEAETTLSRAPQFILTHGLKLNAKKTQCIFLGTRQLVPKIPANTTITLHNTTITPNTHVKNLGVHFDTYMTFETHINEISKKVTGTLMYINRVKYCFDKSTRILVVQSLVLNLLSYCNTVWGTTNIILIDAVQKLQNFAIKVVDGRAKNYDHVTPYSNN